MRLILLGIANHAVLSGSRVTVSLAALAKGATPLTVGVLMALYALLPMVLAVSAGRFSDRVGVRRPMLFGTTAIAVGAALPIAFPGLPILFASAAILGTGFMIFQVATQNVTGELGGPAERARNFSLLALGYSTSGFIGPLVAGLAIDHLGFAIDVRAAGGRAVRAARRARAGRPRAPGPHRHDGPAHHGGVRALLRHRTLRRLLRDQRAVRCGLGPVHRVRADLRRADRALRIRDRSRAVDVRGSDVRRAVPDAAHRAQATPSSRC